MRMPGWRVFKTLKYEEVYLCEYETPEDVVIKTPRNGVPCRILLILPAQSYGCTPLVLSTLATAF